MKDLIRFDQDWHVKSIFSDGTATVLENVHVAETLGLRSLCVVDRAGSTSDWVPDFCEACRVADKGVAVRVSSGVEVQVMNTHGTLDVPPAVAKADYTFVVADHLPTPSGPLDSEVAREQIQSGELFPARAVEWLVRAYANATRRDAAIVLARPFGLLPRLGIDPGTIHPAYLRWLAGVMVENGARSEINEACRTPSLLAVDCFLTAGVQVLPASGADTLEDVGRFSWYPQLMGGLSSLARA